MKHIDITPEQADANRARTERIEAESRARFAVDYADALNVTADYARQWDNNRRASRGLVPLPTYARR